MKIFSISSITLLSISVCQRSQTFHIIVRSLLNKRTSHFLGIGVRKLDILRDILKGCLLKTDNKSGTFVSYIYKILSRYKTDGKMVITWTILSSLSGNYWVVTGIKVKSSLSNIRWSGNREEIKKEDFAKIFTLV